MEIKLTENIIIEMNLPIKGVESFRYSWKPDCHGRLHLTGYMDMGTPWNAGTCYDSYVKLWRFIDEKAQILFQGCITGMEIKNIGQLKQVFLEVTSASCLLDRKNSIGSFQNCKMTYGEVVRQAVQNEGGQVIRNRESDKEIGYPLIRNEETVWQFAGRMAKQLNTSIIPDIETGEPNLWFGMRKGQKIESFPENECRIILHPRGGKAGILIQVNSDFYYKIGDSMTYMGQKMVITVVEGQFRHGELVFLYTLTDMAIREKPIRNYPAGLGYWGTIVDVKAESVRLALDIDCGEDTGEYYFPWNPVTGNFLYALPEKGAKALLRFNKENFQDGEVIHCLNQQSKNKCNYRSRAFNVQNGNTITMFEETVGFLRGENHMLALKDHSISAETVNKLEISAKSKILLEAAHILIEAPNELTIYQG